MLLPDSPHGPHDARFTPHKSSTFPAIGKHVSHMNPGDAWASFHPRAWEQVVPRTFVLLPLLSHTIALAA